MRVILLCAAFALSVATEPVEEPESIQQNKTGVEKLERLLRQKTGRMSYWDGGITSPPHYYGAENDCPSSFYQHKLRCFAFFSSPMAWIDAEKQCWNYGANLASIHDEEERNFIQTLIWTDGPVWIGGSNGVRSREFLWSDGSVFDLGNWATLEPVSYSSWNRWAKCIIVNQQGYLKKWYCEAKLPFICGTRPPEDILPGNQPPYVY